MSKELSANGGKPFRGAVPLGGREYRINLGRRHDSNLRALATAFNTSPVTFAEHLLTQAIDDASLEYVRYAKVTDFMVRALTFRAEAPSAIT